MQSKSELRQKKLFLKTPILKTILIVALPSIVVALMSSLYAFIDQILMIKLIPSVISNNQMFENYDEFLNIQSQHSDFISLINVTTVVRTAIAYSAPITVFINAATLLVANGTAINYSKSSGSTNIKKTKNAWCLGFYMNLFFSIIVTILLMSIIEVWMKFEAGNSLQSSIDVINQSSELTGNEKSIVIGVYQIAFEQTHQYSAQYSYLITAGTIFSMYTSFLSLLIISEGKQIVVILVAIFCNLINILLDWIFIDYGNLAMIGGAIATVIGWILNSSFYFLYLWYLGKRNETQLDLKDLKHISFSKEMSWSIFSCGLPSLLRNISLSIMATIQLGLLASITPIISSYSNSMFQDIYGAVNPIFNLFFTAELGIIQGTRIICSYTYGAKDFKRLKNTYWLAMTIGFIYGWIMVLLLNTALTEPLLSIFDITNGTDPNKYEIAKMMLLISSLQMPIFAFAIGGMMLFQSTGMWIRASISGLMQGVICNFPISYLMKYISLWTNNIDVFLWNQFVVLGVSSVIVFIWSTIYCQKKFKTKLFNR